MIPDNAREAWAFGALSGLRAHEPARDRAARIRARAHARLGRSTGRTWTLGDRRGRGWMRVLEPALVGAAGALYLTAVVEAALRLSGL